MEKWGGQSAHGLLKASPEQLDAIRDRVIALGIPCSASY